MCARRGWFDSMPVLRAGAGSRPGGRGTFLCVAKETYPKERRPRCPCPPRLWRGGSLRCSVLGCAAELAAFFELRSNSCGKLDNDARVLRHALTPGPALLGTVRRGWERAPHGPLLRSACGPSLRSARQGDRPAVGSAQREPTPGAAAQAAAVWYPLPTPAGCAEERRSWGERVCRRTHTLRCLARRCCLSGVRRTKRVQRRHASSEHRRLPVAKRRDADWGPPSLW
jgi:hypothetical protein